MDILQRFNQVVSAGEGPLTIIELGAYDGYHTALMAGMAAATGRPRRHYAFEPNGNRQLIEVGARCGVTIVRAAIGAVDSDAVDWWQSDGIQTTPGEGHGQRFDGSSSIRRPTAHNSAVYPQMNFRPSTCRCVRLDTFVAEQGIDLIDFIYADIQGAEVDMIRGGTEALKRTKYLYSEFANTPHYEGQINLDEILKMLGPNWKLEGIFESDNLLAVNRMLAPI